MVSILSMFLVLMFLFVLTFLLFNFLWNYTFILILDHISINIYFLILIFIFYFISTIFLFTLSFLFYFFLAILLIIYLTIRLFLFSNQLFRTTLNNKLACLTYIPTFNTSKINCLQQCILNKIIFVILVINTFFTIQYIIFWQSIEYYVACIQIDAPYYTFFNLVILLFYLRTLLRWGWSLTTFFWLWFFYFSIFAFLHFLLICMIAFDFVDTIRTFRYPSIFQCIYTEISIILSIADTPLWTFNRYFLSFDSFFNIFWSLDRSWYIFINFLILSKFIRDIRPCLSIYFIF